MTKYVYSGATGSANGSSWAKAYTTLSAAAAAASAGEDIYVSQDHSESQSATYTLALPGTSTSPNRVICVNRAGSVPPVSADLRTTGIVATSATTNITMTGYAYIYGIIFNLGTAGLTSNMNLGTGSNVGIWFDNCQIVFVSTNSTSNMAIVATAEVKFTNGIIQFAHVAQKINIETAATVAFKNITFQGVSTTTLFSFTNNRPSSVLLDGCDISLQTSSSNYIWNTPALGLGARIQINNCKLGSQTPLLSPSDPSPGQAIDIINSDSGSATVRNERWGLEGTTTTDTSTTKVSGSSDGTTNYSQKMVSTARPTYYNPMSGLPIARWFPNASDTKTVGQSISVSIDILGPGGLTSSDIWLEVAYHSSASTPIDQIVNNSAGVLVTPGNGTTWPTGTATWNNPGSNVPQTITLTGITPQLAGLLRVTVKIAKTSATIWVDPLIKVS